MKPRHQSRRTVRMNTVEREWRIVRDAMGVIEIDDPISGCLRYQNDGARRGRWARRV